MARQQGLPDTAQKVNLAAIQNLNSYIDGVNKLMKRDDVQQQYPFPNEQHTVEIEFVIPMAKNQAETAQHHHQTPSSGTAGNRNNQFVVSTSRRKLELLVPPMAMPSMKVKHHVTRQFLRLLRISDLPVPASLSIYDEEEDYDNGEDYDTSSSSSSDSYGRPKQRQRQQRKMTPWEASRDRFWKRNNRSFDFKKFNQVYREALHDAEVHLQTRNWIRDSPRLRHKLLANGKFVCALP